MAVTRYSFSYCGISCEELGLVYIPDAKGRATDEADYSAITETITGRTGVNWYGNTVKERSFTQECFYEDLSAGDIEAISRWMHKDTYGELRFSDRPWCHYMCRPSKKTSGERYRAIGMDGNIVYSGKITFTLTCDEGYARMNYKSIDDKDTDNAMSMCGIVYTSQMPALEVKTGQQLVYNPGSEKTSLVKITIAGTAPDGLTIGNYTTGDLCKLVSLPSSKSLIINSEFATVTYSDTGNYAFSHHNYGYITLAGCGMYRRNVPVKTTSGSNIVTSQYDFIKGMDAGKYIWLSDKWHKILYVTDNSHIIIDETMSETTLQAAMITQMNEIYVTGPNASLTQFEIDYTPLIR